MHDVAQRLANRHIAKLFDALDEAGITLSEIVKARTRRQMHMLAEDVARECTEGAWNGDRDKAD